MSAKWSCDDSRLYQGWSDRAQGELRPWTLDPVSRACPQHPV